jgi:hypothetical protein
MIGGFCSYLRDGQFRPTPNANYRILVPGQRATEAGALFRGQTVWRVIQALKRDCFSLIHTPFAPAEAGGQFLAKTLGPRFRGDERVDSI